MGFFSDLKEDLSQAVNELMPEEALDAAQAGSPEMENVVSAEQYVQDTPVTEEIPETVNSLDISSMLDKLDEVDTVEETEQEVSAVPETSEDTSWAESYVKEDVTETEEIEIPEEPVIEEAKEEPLFAEAEEEAVEEEVAAEETEMEAENILSQPGEEEEKTMDMQINRVAVDETAVVTEGITITGDIKS